MLISQIGEQYFFTVFRCLGHFHRQDFYEVLSSHTPRSNTAVNQLLKRPAAVRWIKMWNEKIVLPHLCLFEQPLYQTLCQNQTKKADTSSPLRNTLWKMELIVEGTSQHSQTVLASSCSWTPSVTWQSFTKTHIARRLGPCTWQRERERWVQSKQRGKTWSTFTRESQKKTERIGDLRNSSKLNRSVSK